ncbi:monovalent cation:proton antiporter family protein [Pelagibaculum spongiae]|uniref:Potassium transporter n=1 Tax=Pelagibaculum spongiae TaxID=2080658 RepID=A0A2V1GMW3_9GAMM|nr:monovalent cation:proton antiporter family protein [Pelagibaculum spongiae]PVZ62957.1 potassium transporter [Pelagibaculum spongiae]
MSEHLLAEFLVMLSASVLVIALLSRLALPAILGFLLVGLAIGPHALALVNDQHSVELIAELGVVLLLFTLGLEFSIPQLYALRYRVFGIGGAQVIISTGSVFFISLWLGISWQAAFVISAAMALSSTAIVTRQLSQQAKLHTQSSQTAIAILLFQDLAAIPFLIIVPALTLGSGDQLASELGWAVAKGAVIFLALLTVGRWLLPRIFHEAAQTGSDELFALAALLVALLTAWITSLAGLSMALGAFLAGVMLGETHFRHQIEAEIRPFRDILLGLFFITIGMKLSFPFLLEHPWTIIGLTAAIIVCKAGLVTILSMISRSSMIDSVRAGLYVAQGGEFGFVILALADQHHLVPDALSQQVLASLIFSMLITPFLIREADWLAKKLPSQPWKLDTQQTPEEVVIRASTMRQHVLICGFGRSGQGLGRLLDQLSIRWLALDRDPIRTSESLTAGERVVYGDASHRAILSAAGIERASLLVISFDNWSLACKVINHARSLAPEISILVRCRRSRHLDELIAAGANSILREGDESTLQLANRVLQQLGTSQTVIDELIHQTRNQDYQLLQGYLPGIRLEMQTQQPRRHAITLDANAWAIDKPLIDVKQKMKRGGAIIKTIRRRNRSINAEQADLVLHRFDTVVLLGNQEQIEAAEETLLSGN